MTHTARRISTIVRRSVSKAQDSEAFRMKLVSRLVEGECSKVIANKLGLNHRTVSWHINKQMKLAGAKNYVQFGMWLAQQGFPKESK